MKLVELKIAWRYIKSKRREKFISASAIFSLLGVILGVATLIIVTSVMNGFRYEFASRVIGFNGHFALYSNGSNFDAIDVVKKIESISHVKTVIPVIERQALISNNSQIYGSIVLGISRENLKKYDLILKNICYGTIANFDECVEAPGIILGSALRNKFRCCGGDKLIILAPEFEHTGVGAVPRKKTFHMASSFSSGMHEYDSSVSIIPIEIAKILFKVNTPCTTILVFVNDPMKLDEVRLELDENFSSLFHITDWMHANSAFMNAIEIERNVMFLILLMITLVASFNIISCMIMLVKDKEREIAILKTIGVQSSAIKRIFFVIGTSIGLVGTVIGAISGLAFSLNIEKIRVWLEHLLSMNLFPGEVYFLTRLPSVVDYKDVVLIVSLALIISCLATIYPARKAAKLKPAEILRYA